MKAKMCFSLKPGERIFINGAVLRAEQRVSLSLLNEASFLLEPYVLQFDQAKTPLRRLYFIIQTMIIHPSTRDDTSASFKEQFDDLSAIYERIPDAKSLSDVHRLVMSERYFDALKVLKKLFAVDDAIAGGAPLEVSKAA
jgi:flagellar protein FlbT